MNQYHPLINPAAHSLEWLQKRRGELAKLGLTGTINEKKSIHRKAEMAAIDAGLRARGAHPTQIPRTRPLPQSAIGDTARMQAHAVAGAPVPVGVRGYSHAVGRVETDFNPVKYDRYA